MYSLFGGLCRVHRPTVDDVRLFHRPALVRAVPVGKTCLPLGAVGTGTTGPVTVPETRALPCHITQPS